MYKKHIKYKTSAYKKLKTTKSYLLILNVYYVYLIMCITHIHTYIWMIQELHYSDFP